MSECEEPQRPEAITNAVKPRSLAETARLRWEHHLDHRQRTTVPDTSQYARLRASSTHHTTHLAVHLILGMLPPDMLKSQFGLDVESLR